MAWSVDEWDNRSDDQDVEGGREESQDQDGSNLTKEVGMVETVGSVEDDGRDQDLQVNFLNFDILQDISIWEGELHYQCNESSTDHQNSRFRHNLWEEVKAEY